MNMRMMVKDFFIVQLADMAGAVTVWHRCKVSVAIDRSFYILVHMYLRCIQGFRCRVSQSPGIYQDHGTVRVGQGRSYPNYVLLI